MNNFLVMKTDMVCTKDGTFCLEGNNAIVITASVGLKGINIPDDVRKIQEGLNKVPPSQGGPTVPLAVTGISDERTWQAIHAFQRHHFGWSGADGKVDPGYQTLIKLNEIVGTNNSRNVPFLVGLLSHYELTLRGIRAAHSKVIAALSVVGDTNNGSGPSGRAAAMDSLNRHFQIDDYPPGMRRQILLKIYGAYDTMLNILATPGAEGPEYFELERKGRNRGIATTYANGAFKKGQKEDGIRMDRIYFEQESIEAINNPDYVAYIMTHELAHFVGLSGTYQIEDYALGWYSDPTLQGIPPNRKLVNADCYANFAHESRTENSSRPAWLRTLPVRRW